jgi:hypothetical protein
MILTIKRVVVIIIIIIIIVVIVVIVIVVGRVVLLANTGLAQRGDAGNVEARVGAEALDLELRLLIVIVVAGKIDIAGAGQFAHRLARRAADLRHVVPVEVNIRDGHHGRRGYGESSKGEAHCNGLIE